jgi:hypothetical protein
MSEPGQGIEKAVGFKSPTSGGNLTKNEDGLYHGDSEGLKYKVNEGSGKVVPLVDPMSGGELIQNSDGTFVSITTGKNFAFVDNDHFVPLYIPDDTGESAHIENGNLVGNETGRSFEIDEKGTVLTPEEIKKREIGQVFTDKINALEDEMERKNQEALMEMLKQPVLEGETVEQRNQRVKKMFDVFTQKLFNISEEYFIKFDEIKREIFSKDKVSDSQSTDTEIIEESLVEEVNAKAEQ